MIRLLYETRLNPEFPLSRIELQPLMGSILEVLGLEGDSLILRLVDDEEIAELNREFLGCFGPTNVLSFPAADVDAAEEENEVLDDEDDGETAELQDIFEADDDDDETEQGVFLGEIALSVDTLAREVRLYGQEPREHLIRLLAHATLHLSGLDHGPEMEAFTEAAVEALA